MQQDSSTRVPPPYPPPPQGPNFISVPPQNKGNYQTVNPKSGTLNSNHAINISEIEGYEALKSIIRILNVYGYIFLCLAGLALLVGFIISVNGITGIFAAIPMMVSGLLIFGLSALAMFAARDNIKIKIEHLEVSYKILDALTVGKN